MIAYNIQNGQPRQRQKDPLDGGYLMSANCTDVKPPDFDFKTHTCKFDGASSPKFPRSRRNTPRNNARGGIRRRHP